MVGAVLGAVAALVIALAISLGTAGRTSSHGCIYLTIPAATGAQEIYHCGAAARSICESSQVPGTFSPQAAQSIGEACRKAGLSVAG